MFANAALCVVRDILWKYSENLFWFSTLLGIKYGGPSERSEHMNTLNIGHGMNKLHIVS
jgi:hypothetical protein